MSDRISEDESIFEDVCTCEYCGKRGNRYDRHGQEMFRLYEGTLLCINHYSQAKWPDTYKGDCEILEWLGDE